MESALVLFAIMAGVIGLPMLIVFLVPTLSRAVARRIEGTPGAADTAAELEALQDEVARLRALVPRVLELEERMEFAERLLPSPGERAELSSARRSDA